MEHLLQQLLVWWIHLWPHLLTAAILVIDLVLSTHAILTKRDTRSTIGWVGLIWFSPVFGAIAYTLLGVNRIRSRASRLRAGTVRIEHEVDDATAGDERLTAAIGPPGSPLRSLAVLVERVTERPLTEGNAIEPLDGGDAAFP
ncbi:MAG: PLDc N-terminal domain-containing protein, partial [Thermoleophilia bacterium]|nr:PLDc N-terminal domain-containing protein [Thermoleophilia bacterium]